MTVRSMSYLSKDMKRRITTATGCQIKGVTKEGRNICVTLLGAEGVKTNIRFDPKKGLRTSHITEQLNGTHAPYTKPVKQRGKWAPHRSNYTHDQPPI